MFNFISYIAILACINLNDFIFRYQGADKVSDHVSRPVSRRTFDKSEYRGTKESQLMAP